MPSPTISCPLSTSSPDDCRLPNHSPLIFLGTPGLEGVSTASVCMRGLEYPSGPGVYSIGYAYSPVGLDGVGGETTIIEVSMRYTESSSSSGVAVIRRSYACSSRLRWRDAVGKTGVEVCRVMVGRIVKGPMVMGASAPP